MSARERGVIRDNVGHLMWQSVSYDLCLCFERPLSAFGGLLTCTFGFRPVLENRRGSLS